MSHMFGDTQELSSTSLGELRLLVEEFGQLKDRRNEIAAEEKKLIANEKNLTDRIQAILKEANLDEFSVPDVGKVYKIEKFYASLPANESEWNALFKFLKEQDREDLITVNSASLTSFYKERMEAALESGDANFKIPGVNNTGMRINLGFRRSK